jgi:Ca-activated chloride channel family protein
MASPVRQKSVSCINAQTHTTIFIMNFGWLHLGVLATVLTLGGAAHSAPKCKLALVLAIDVSGSVNQAEYALQTNGLTAALRAPDIAHAIRFPGNQGIMATIVHWSGDPHQYQLVPWSFLSDAASIEDFANRAESAKRAFINFSTAIGNALGFSAGLFGQLPMACGRKVIDVSGDGRNNEGADASEIRDAIVASGITINGLAIIGPDEGLPDYYRQQVIGGPNAFVIPAKTFKDYPDAIRRKLLREITPPLAMLD